MLKIAHLVTPVCPATLVHGQNLCTWWFMFCFLSKQLSILALWGRPEPRLDRSMNTVDMDFPGWSRSLSVTMPENDFYSWQLISILLFICFTVFFCFFFCWVIYPRSVLLKLTDPPFTCLVPGTFNISDSKLFLTSESYWWATKGISSIKGNCIHIWLFPSRTCRRLRRVKSNRSIRPPLIPLHRQQNIQTNSCLENK